VDHSIEKIIYLVSKDPEKGSEYVAKTFYKILRKNSFSDRQIINIATNILGCLIESLEGYDKKVQKESKKEAEVNPMPKVFYD
jgi:hypothetical protein